MFLSKFIFLFKMNTKKLIGVVEKEFDELLEKIGFKFTKEYLQSRIYQNISAKKKYQKKVNKMIDAEFQSYEKIGMLEFSFRKKSYTVKRFSILDVDFEDIDKLIGIYPGKEIPESKICRKYILSDGC